MFCCNKAFNNDDLIWHLDHWKSFLFRKVVFFAKVTLIIIFYSEAEFFYLMRILLNSEVEKPVSVWYKKNLGTGLCGCQVKDMFSHLQGPKSRLCKSWDVNPPKYYCICVISFPFHCVLWCPLGTVTSSFYSISVSSSVKGEWISYSPQSS